MRPFYAARRLLATAATTTFYSGAQDGGSVACTRHRVASRSPEVVPVVKETSLAAQRPDSGPPKHGAVPKGR